MHEVGLVEDAVARAVIAAREAGARSIERLTFALEAGGHVTPEAVQTLVELASKGTPAEGAALAFETRPGRYGCWACGGLFESLAEPSHCPICAGGAIHRRPGIDLALIAVDVAG